MPTASVGVDLWVIVSKNSRSTRVYGLFTDPDSAIRNKRRRDRKYPNNINSVCKIHNAENGSLNNNGT